MTKHDFLTVADNDNHVFTDQCIIILLAFPTIYPFTDLNVRYSLQQPAEQSASNLGEAVLVTNKLQTY